MTSELIAALAADMAAGHRGVPTTDEIEAHIDDFSPASSLTVAEAAEATGISAHTLRYYERIGLIAVARDSRGHRTYSPDTVNHAIFLYRMRCSGMRIERLREYVALMHDGEATVGRRRALLQEHRDALALNIA